MTNSARTNSIKLYVADIVKKLDILALDQSGAIEAMARVNESYTTTFLKTVRRMGDILDAENITYDAACKAARTIVAARNTITLSMSAVGIVTSLDNYDSLISSIDKLDSFLVESGVN